MTDKINELKSLIESLDADSPLRASLEEALNAEQKRQDGKVVNKTSTEPLQSSAVNNTDDREEEDKENKGKNKENEQKEDDKENKQYEDNMDDEDGKDDEDDEDGEDDEDDEDGEDDEDDEESSAASSSNFLDDITDKLDDLLNDDEFIAASAGFLLGAVTIGAGALFVSALKK